MTQTITAPSRASGTAAPVLGAISFCHLLNDMLQSLLPAVYPILKGGFDLNFGQIGILTLTYQVTASLLQPLIGLYTDRRPQPFSLPIGMMFTLLGLVTLALAPSYTVLLAGAALLGTGSSIFHPESSRIARLASGGRHGLAQSVFQVGGNFGQALGPLLAAFFVLPRGRASIAWFGFAAVLGMAILSLLGRWYQANGHAKRPARNVGTAPLGLSTRRVTLSLAVLVALIFSKFFYLASFTSYYIFYLIQRFHLGVQAAQVDLFIFMAASAAGTVIGGPVGDRIGRKRVIWGSIAGVLPFTLALPYVGLSATIGLSVIIGLVLSSAFAAIVVYAQELLPGRVGTVSGLFFGLAFGMGGLGAAVLGVLADHTSIGFVYHVCSFLPLIGLTAAFLPNFGRESL
ncbi:MFS transporter [Acidocella aminolytica]|uniref:Major facilitator superfamily transporter n=1 Tax=Acidocella aminolytica 101 = DSM 11237 TaxID=1120923 RepID=A0A0D6PCR5_9PROT|nr:MFS transporter [Acidocella aminolytica]GAN79565.1 major facilitator superfamily transporter [Acidocella aminolytica 101 = DSM 11237]GBQ39221.1 major facilitator superfamily transporter [Acidocella aminolytica 101 = DSM 11237]SHF28062.1 MFS transporter, FSR family, fosmidomycin resistance protein [Acidocella aminolytica 101 = DSM 11237]